MKNRRVEYLSASVMVGWAAILALPGNTIAEREAFASFIERGWTEVELAAILAIAGTMWLGALWVNGHHRRSPVFRCIGSAAGVVMWSHIAFMLITNAMLTGTWSTGVAVYGLLAAFDLMSCARSAADAYNAHVRGLLLDEMVSRNDP